MFPSAAVGQFISEIHIGYIVERCEIRHKRTICKGDIEILIYLIFICEDSFGKRFRLGFLSSKISFRESL